MLHAPTLLFALVLTDLAFAAVSWVAVPRGSQEASRSARAWSWALVWQALAFAALGARSLGPEWLSIAFVNVATPLAVGQKASALLALRGRSLPRGWSLWLPAACLVVPLLGLHSLRVRIVHGSAIFGGLQLGVGVLAWRLRDPQSRIGWRLVAASSCAAGLLLLARGVFAVWGGVVVFAVDEGPAPAASALLGQLLTVTTAVGFLLVHRERHEHEIEHLAMTDALTGAYNRRMLFDLGAKELARARRENRAFAALLLDLDRFKAINDLHGHQAGDDVLQRFAEVVGGCLRSTDVLARYGGEEFCVLLPGATAENARVVAERILAAVHATRFTTAGRTVPLTASIGLAALTDDVSALEPLLRRADDALYRAKHAGRNRVEVA